VETLFVLFTLVNYCELMLENTLYATGENVKGNLGIGNNQNSKEFIPVDFFTNLEILKISCGSYHTIIQCSTKIEILIA
jgi:alpha-tubulin suppressor-like RCC1 family protein